MHGLGLVVRLCLAAFVLLMAGAVGPAAPPKEKPRLAVLDFFPVGHTDKQCAAPLADKVSETLQNTGTYLLVNRSAVKARMDEKDWAGTSAVDQAKRVTALGKELDAGWIVWGRYTDMGRVWSVTLFMLNVTTGEQSGVVTDDVSGAPDALAGELLKIAPQATHRLLMQLGQKTGPIVLPGLPDLPPVTLPPMPAGVDELDARCRQIQAIHAELTKLRETHTEKHPHVIFLRSKEEELGKALLPDLEKAIVEHQKQCAQMEVYYKPAHPAMQALRQRLDEVNKMRLIVRRLAPEQASLGTVLATRADSDAVVISLREGVLIEVGQVVPVYRESTWIAEVRVTEVLPQMIAGLVVRRAPSQSLVRGDSVYPKERRLGATTAPTTTP